MGVNFHSTKQILLLSAIYQVLLCSNVHAADKIHNTINCAELSFVPNIVLMVMYITIVCSAAYCHGRHRGEYIREIRLYHKLWMWFVSYILLYIIGLSWIYYNFFHSENDVNYIEINFPWLTWYAIAYICYSLISTFAFAYHSHYDNASLIQLVCLLCTVLPLGLAILTFFLFRKTHDIKHYESGLFDVNKKVSICFNIDLLSMVLTCLLLLAFCHHIYVLCRVFYCFIKDTRSYLSHPFAYRGQTSNITRSTTATKKTRGKRRYVYNSEESESPRNQQEISVDVQVPEYRQEVQDTLKVPGVTNGSDEVIELNQSLVVHRTQPFGGSVSFDI